MIIEEISVTSSPTKLLDLINTARSQVSFIGNIKVSSIAYRIDSSVVEAVFCAEDDTATAIKLMDPTLDVPQLYASHEETDIDQIILSVVAGPVSVGVIASQKG